MELVKAHKNGIMSLNIIRYNSFCCLQRLQDQQYHCYHIDGPRDHLFQLSTITYEQ